MSWKITLGKPNDPYIIGKRWIKKHISKSSKIPKAFHKEDECPGAIYDIGMHYLPDDPEDRQNLWVCIETGKLMKSPPKTVARPKIRPKKPNQKIQQIQPKPKPEIKVPKKEEPVKPEPTPEPLPEPEPPKPLATKETSISEIKGIGKAAYEKLTAAEIATIDDLLGKHSQEIATLIGRKSDAQIKKWQETARSMIR